MCLVRLVAFTAMCLRLFCPTPAVDVAVVEVLAIRTPSLPPSVSGF